jgi:type IV pilus assembly protein PilW
MRHVRTRFRAARGVTLIELMVAMVLGLVVAGGIITLFMSTSNSNRVQTQLARLQEDGRFAIGQLSDDLSMATGLYCNNTGGIAAQSTSKVFLDGLRTPNVLSNNLTANLFENTTAWGATSGTNKYPTQPVAPYPMPSFFFMRGYSCSGTADCKPIKVEFLGGAANTAGTSVGNRVQGTDVLTVRYLDSSRGWRLGSNNIAKNAADGSLAEIDLAPASNEPAKSEFKSKTALLADCSTAQIFDVTGSGTGVLKPDPTNNLGKPIAPQALSPARVFDFKNDMRNVTYYVQMVSDDGSDTGVKTGALMRRLNGSTPDQELIRGVERLTFRYGVEDASGGVRFLTADQVDAASGLTCPPTATNLTTTDPGCLWRAVKMIEVSLLLSSTADMANLTQADTGFFYSPDTPASGGTVAASTPLFPSSASSVLAIKPSTQGFGDKRLRRQFTALVMLRNYNP